MTGIVAVLASLLLPAVMMVRAAADQARCTDNVRQIGLAIHLYAQQRGGRLPSVTLGANGDPRESMFFAIPTFLEHGNYYERTKATGRYSGDYLMKQYLCYADPSVAWPDARSRTNFAANAQVFSAVNRRLPMLPTTFRDGTSTIIAIAEHYAMCPGSTFDPARDDVHPVTIGAPPTSTGSIEGLIFQVRPSVAATGARIAQTAHRGMVVGMGDAGVRMLRRETAASVYWALVTPADSEQVTLTD